MKKRKQNLVCLSVLLLSLICQINGQIGELSVTGDFTLTSTSVYEAEISDVSGAGFGHDRITVSEDLNIDGTLNIPLVGYSPDEDDEFDIITYSGSLSGTFATINWPTDMISQGWEIDYGLIYPGTVTIYVPAIALPVELLSFTGRSVDGFHVLDWETASELNNDYFSLECSFDNYDYFEIGKIEGAENSSVSNIYNFFHQPDRIGNHYYRIKQIDLDGKHAYSNIVSVINEVKEDVVFYPNPTTNRITFSEEVSEITILNLNGVEILSNNLSSKTYDVSNLPSGMYIIKAGEAGLLTELLIINN